MAWVGVAGLGLFGSGAYAQQPLGGPITYEYGQAYVTIGDPGNRAGAEEEYPYGLGRRGVGSVGYEYRIAQTEFTVEQHIQFALAYAPYYFADHDRFTATPDFAGDFFTLVNIGGQYGVSNYVPSEAHKPSNLGWEYAARHANWLHNDKRMDREAFEAGAYDTSTFTTNPDGTHNHQWDPAPGARFWIPTYDEWTKAAYWDPNKDEGAGGYWQFPNGSDAQSIAGLPGKGGERNAGVTSEYPLDVGSFPGVQSPWGVLDMSGGQSEFTTTVIDQPFYDYHVYLKGTMYFDPTTDNPFNYDRFGFGTFAVVGSDNDRTGLRLAARAVPGPGGVSLLIGIWPHVRRKR
jgi:hypothetical protein